MWDFKEKQNFIEVEMTLPTRICSHTTKHGIWNDCLHKRIRCTTNWKRIVQNQLW